MSASKTVRMCTLCGNPKQSQVVKSTFRVDPIEVFVCNICDRRKCKGCDHYEQDQFTRFCSNCKAVY